MCPSLQQASPGWQAGLTLEFYNGAGKTCMRQRAHHGPLQTQRPFYPEGDGVCHAYILHPPGGVVGGDELHMDIKVGRQCHALLTTPAAGKFYRSGGAMSLLHQNMNVAEDAILEWLPQENIIYNRAKAKQTTTVHLPENGEFLGWEISCLGLAASKDPFVEGQFQQEFEIHRQGVPQLLERTVFATDSPLFSAQWGMQNRSVTGTLICTSIGTSKRQALLDEIRQSVQTTGDELFCTTTVSDMVVCRYLGDHAYRARYHFIKAWHILRRQVFMKTACPPRIWKT